MHRVESLCSFSFNGEPMKTIQDLLTAMQSFYARLNTLFHSNVAEAVTAQDTKALQGSTPAQVATFIAGTGAAHVAARGRAPHQETAAALGMYTNEQVAPLIANRPVEAVLPISRFGSLNFLPVGTSSGFEGAIHPSDNLHTAMNLEDDGTMVILRPGTDGMTRDIYYAYVTDPLNQAVEIDVRTTTRTYRPPFKPANLSFLRLMRCTREVVCAYMGDEGTNRFIMVALTGSSYNDAGHVGAVIPAAMFPSYFAYGSCDVVLALGRVWFINMSVSGGLNLRVCSVSAAELTAGNVTQVREDTGWTTVNMYGETVTSTYIQATNVSGSDSSAAKPYVLYNKQGGMNITADLMRSSENRSPLNGTFDTATNRYMMNVENQHGFSWQRLDQPTANRIVTFRWTLWIDFAAKTAQVEKLGDPATLFPPLVVTNNVVTGNLDFTGTMASHVWDNDNDRGVDRPYFKLINDAGREYFVGIKSSMNWWGSYSHTLNVYSYPSTIGLTDIYDGSKAVSASWNKNGRFAPQYGGPWGRRFGNPAFIGPNRVIVNGEGNYDGGTFGNNVTSVGDVSTTVDYSYQSLNNGTMLGGAPRSWRQPIGTFAPGKNDLAGGLVNEFNFNDLNTFTTTQACAAEGTRLVLGRDLNDRLETSGTLTITAAMLADLRTKMLARFRDSAIDVADTADTFRISWIIPKNAPAVVVSYSVLPTGVMNMGLMRVEPNAKTGTVASYTEYPDTWSLTAAGTNYLRLVGIPQAERWAAGFIGEGSTHYMYRMASGQGGSQSNSSTQMGFLTFFNKAAQRFERVATLAPGWQQDSSQHVFMPGVGVIHAQCTTAVGDMGSKLFYRPFYRTFEEAINNTPGPDVSYVLLSMVKPAQWNLSFTESSDLIMSGKHYVLEPTTLFLSDVTSDPSNKTFYIYVRILAGKAVYQARVTEIPESSSVMFIGTVTTGVNSILANDIRKVTRLGNYRLSTTAVGSAIPVSSGNPDEARPLLWT